MPSKDKKSNNDKKRKYTSPKENPIKVTRRRFLSSSLPELNLIDNTFNQLAELKMEDKTGSTFIPPPSDLPVRSSAAQPVSPSKLQTANTNIQQPIIQAEGQTYSLPELIFKSMCDPSFIEQLVPVLATAIAPSIEMAVQSVFQKLNSTIQEQAKEITDLKKSLEKAEETKTNLQKQIWCLEESVDDLEQYGRRNSLRFHNCPVHTGTLDTDCMIIDLCKDKLGIQLTEEDIFRSHPIGKPNRNGNIQIICRFKNWKVKNKVFSKKRQLKNTSIFLTEDLTRFRQSLIQDLTKAKRGGSIHSFWTNDGRIFARFEENGPKHMIRSFNDIPRPEFDY